MIFLFFFFFGVYKFVKFGSSLNCWFIKFNKVFFVVNKLLLLGFMVVRVVIWFFVILLFGNFVVILVDYIYILVFKSFVVW